MARSTSRRTLPGPTAHHVVPALLSWFAAHARDLPWRRQRDPYAIWVSEIMLQQTQVKTVIPFWERWMQTLPTVQALAQASPALIHKLWEGLGYYTRVRNLQRAAQAICAGHGGRFPEDFEAILALPGIGRYTAGAIASIAFNQPAPILDGNVIRVLTRLHGIAADPREKQTNAQLWRLAQELVEEAHDNRGSGIEDRNSKLETRNPKPESPNAPSALNQSLMELGALVCTPRSPNCAACPLAALCVARRENRTEQIPRVKARATPTARRFIVMILQRDGRYLVRQRPADAVNAHLWEFPNREATDQEPAAAVIAEQLGQPPAAIASLCTVKHSITRYRMTTEAWLVASHREPAKLPGQWRTPAQLHQLAFTSAHRRIVQRLEKGGGVIRCSKSETRRKPETRNSPSVT
jgi:A/G-specific adenine glycosylase